MCASLVGKGLKSCTILYSFEEDFECRAPVSQQYVLWTKTALPSTCTIKKSQYTLSAHVEMILSSDSLLIGVRLPSLPHVVGCSLTAGLRVLSDSMAVVGRYYQEYYISE